MNRTNNTYELQTKLSDFICELLKHVAITFDGGKGTIHIDIDMSDNVRHSHKDKNVVEDKNRRKQIQYNDRDSNRQAREITRKTGYSSEM